MPFHTHTLPNGLQLIGETLPSARSAAVGFFVRTGARDETPAEAGVSHFLEHMAFKGTPRRTALDVNLHFDRIGAKANAYTSEEATVYYSAVLPEYLPTALDILADILRPSLRGEDFDSEKKVILEEIAMYHDQPGAMAGEHARRIYYAGHPLGNSVLGSTASVGALTREPMRAYFDRRYAPGNVVLAATDQLDWPRLVELAQSACGDWNGAVATRGSLTPSTGVGGTHAVEHVGAAQQHVMVCSPGPSAEDPDRYPAETLALILGGETGSRYYWELVHPGDVESAGCYADQSQANGMYWSTFSGEPEKAAENLATVRRILSEVQRDGVTAEELHQAKSKITSGLVRRSERPMGRLGVLASAWVYNREYLDIDTELARYDTVTLDAIRAVLDRFPLDRATTVGYGPLTAL